MQLIFGCMKKASSATLMVGSSLCALLYALQNMNFVEWLKVEKWTHGDEPGRMGKQRQFAGFFKSHVTLLILGDLG